MLHPISKSISAAMNRTVGQKPPANPNLAIVHSFPKERKRLSFVSYQCITFFLNDYPLISVWFTSQSDPWEANQKQVSCKGSWCIRYTRKHNPAQNQVYSGLLLLSGIARKKGKDVFYCVNLLILFWELVVLVPFIVLVVELHVKGLAAPIVCQ